VIARDGPRLSRVLVAGERDLHTRATWRHSRGNKEADASTRALTGTWREGHLCVLRSPPAPPVLRMTGVDMVAVHGLSDAMAPTLLAEIGTGMSQWPDEQHCCSWLGSHA